jgi:membrane associated rhomboid family serine protease
MNLFGNVGSDSTTGYRASLTTRFNVWLHAIPQFTRSIFIVCTFIWLIRALFNWPNTYAVCFHYDSIKGGEIYRLITFIFFHQDILHIIFNMMGLLSLCVFLEHKLGTIYMLWYWGLSLQQRVFFQVSTKVLRQDLVQFI